MGKQHLQPGLSGTSPVEQWVLSEPHPAACLPGRPLSLPMAAVALTLPGWRRSPWPRTLCSMWTNFCRFSYGWEESKGEMVRTPSRGRIPSVRSGIASTSEEENRTKKGLAQNVTSCQWQIQDLGMGLQDTQHVACLSSG